MKLSQIPDKVKRVLLATCAEDIYDDEGKSDVLEELSNEELLFCYYFACPEGSICAWLELANGRHITEKSPRPSRTRSPFPSGERGFRRSGADSMDLDVGQLRVLAALDLDVELALKLGKRVTARAPSNPSASLAAKPCLPCTGRQATSGGSRFRAGATTPQGIAHRNHCLRLGGAS